MENTARKCDTGGGHTNFFAKLYSRVTHVDHFHLGVSPDDGTVSHSYCGRGNRRLSVHIYTKRAWQDAIKTHNSAVMQLRCWKKTLLQLQIVVCAVHYSGFVVWTKQVTVINCIVTDEDLLLKGMPRAADPTLQDEHTLFYTDFNRPDFGKMMHCAKCNTHFCVQSRRRPSKWLCQQRIL